MSVRRRDERPHPSAEGQPNWVETWLFDVVQADLSVALSIEMLLWPQRRQAGFHASIVRPGHKLVSLVDMDIQAPTPPSIEIRSPGLWAEVGIQTPLEHMTVDIEAFGVELDDPAEVFAGAYGIRTAIGTELEWETVTEPVATADGYEVACIVHGELLLGSETIEIDGWGWRSHRWGVPRRDDRMRFRGRTAADEWQADNATDRELTMQVLGAAPVPDPAVDAKLLQFFARSDDGSAAWIRRSED